MGYNYSKARAGTVQEPFFEVQRRETDVQGDNQQVYENYPEISPAPYPLPEDEMVRS